MTNVPTCPSCGEASGTLSGGRCDRCWDDLANGRDPRKRKRIEPVSEAGDATNANRIQQMIDTLEKLRPNGPALAAAMRRAAEQFGPSAEVLSEMEQAIQEAQKKKAEAERRERDQHPVDALIESRYIDGDPSWKKRTVQATFGTVQEQVGFDTGRDGRPIPGKAFREAYLQTHAAPVNWPEYQEPIAAIRDVDEHGLLRVKRAGSVIETIEPSKITAQEGTDGRIVVAQYDLGGGVQHTHRLTRVQQEGYANWTRERSQAALVVQDETQELRESLAEQKAREQAGEELRATFQASRE